jgi:hypothetical protein
MDQSSCVSCHGKLTKAYVYCFNCNKKLDTLNQCNGKKVNGEQCKLKTTEIFCKYHSKQIQKHEFIEEDE